MLRSPVLSLARQAAAACRAADSRLRTAWRVAGLRRKRGELCDATVGREAFERLVEPLMAGIYVADASGLSLAATMPEFLAAEREHGSLRGGVVARANQLWNRSRGRGTARS